MNRVINDPKIKALHQSTPSLAITLGDYFQGQVNKAALSRYLFVDPLRYQSIYVPLDNLELG